MKSHDLGVDSPSCTKRGDGCDRLADLTLPRFEHENISSLPEQTDDVLNLVSPLLSFIDREQSPRNINDRGIVEVSGELLGFHGGTHKHHPKAWIKLNLQPAPSHENFHIEIPLVHFVENEHSVLTVTSAEELPHESETVSTEQQLGVVAVLTLVSGPETYLATELNSQLLGYPLSNPPSSEPTRLR